MEESVDQVAERLTKLEVAVAEGFVDNKRRFLAIEAAVAKGFLDAEIRDIGLSEKIDVNTESLRADIKTVIETVNSLAAEMRRTTDSVRKEHAANQLRVKS